MVPKLKRNGMDISTIFLKHLPCKTYEGWVGLAGQAKWKERKKLDLERHVPQIRHVLLTPCHGKEKLFPFVHPSARRK